MSALTEHEQAIINTFNYFHPNTRGLCPNCKKYIILPGYRCFGCGFDVTTKSMK